MTTPNLHSLIIKLISTTPGRVRATQGHLAHAAFHHLLHQADPDLAQTLHDWPGRKPFTLSPLYGFGQPHNGHLKLQAGQEGYLRLTILDPHLFQTVIHHFLTQEIAPLRLEKQQFLISQIINSAEAHPLAGYTTLDHLFHHWEQLPLTPQHTHLSLHFASPTAFRIKNNPHRHMLVLPDPAFVFGQLATYWDDLTHSQMTDTTREFASVHVVVAQHRLETHMYEYTKGKQVGFSGTVTFKCLEPANESLLRHLNRLADLAFYTGVGYKTTMGMGQLYRLSHRRSPELKGESTAIQEENNSQLTI